MTIIRIKSITICRAEGVLSLEELRKPATFKTFRDANRQLRSWSYQVPRGESHKVDYRLDYEDGEIFSGVYEISLDQPCDLGAHVERAVDYWMNKTSIDAARRRYTEFFTGRQYKRDDEPSQSPTEASQ